MKITLFGDIMLDQDQIQIRKKADGRFDFKDSICDLSKSVPYSHHYVANLETPISKDNTDLTSHDVSFNSPKELLSVIRKSSIDILSTANNHCFDRGIQGLKNTIDLIKQNDLINIGTHKSNEENHYLVLKDESISVGLVALTYGTNAFLNNCYLNNDQKYMVDLLQEQELSKPFSRLVYNNNSFLGKVLKKTFRTFNFFQERIPVYERKYDNKKQLSLLHESIIKCRKENVDYIIGYLHFGGQFNSEPTNLAREMANTCFDLGVDFIIGNHEHVIQRIERIGNRICAYSLGNFYSSLGVDTGPKDKFAEYSIAITLDLNKNKDPRFIFTFFVNFKGDDGKIYNKAAFDLINLCEYADLWNDINFLLNRIYGTTKVNYPKKRFYEV